MKIVCVSGRAWSCGMVGGLPITLKTPQNGSLRAGCPKRCVRGNFGKEHRKTRLGLRFARSVPPRHLHMVYGKGKVGNGVSMSDPTRQPHLVCHIRFRLIAGCFMGQTFLSDSAILIERPNRCWTDHPDLCETNHFLGNFENPFLVCYDTKSH